MRYNRYMRFLLEKQYNEGLSPDERKALNAFLKTGDGEKQLCVFMDEKALEAFDQPRPISSGHTSSIFNKLQSSIKQEAKMRSRKDAKRFYLYHTPKIAASIVGLLLLVLGGVLAYQKYQTVNYTTDIGQNKTIVLPDLSTVTLNGNSSIKYSQDWESVALREVDLQGEAYFNVTKSKHKPFIVHAGDIEIKVLGTTFTVRSFNGGESVEACLITGRIAIQSKTDVDRNEIILTPNQKATFSKSSQKITLTEVRTEISTPWESGKLIFEDKPFGEIVKSLERKYGIRIKVQDDASQNCRFSATIDQESLKEVLDLFASTTGLSYRISGNAVEIIGRLCTTNP